MKSPILPIPKSLPKLLWLLCIWIVGISVGCAPSEPMGPETESKPNLEFLVRHSVDSDPASATEQEAPPFSPPFSAPSRKPIPQELDSRSSESKQKNSGNENRPPIMAVQLSDTTAFGIPIGLFSDQTLLMRRDGAIQRIENGSILRKSILQDRFRPMDRVELTQNLRAEFGRNYLVRGEAPYLVVARAEHMDVWQQRFRSLYHSFRLYCNTHSIAMRDIEFPLVAVVFGSHAEFLHYASSTRTKLPENCVGFYFPDSNRIALFESPNMTIQEIQATICHEATHQIAFNAGLHQRAASIPLWVIEGLASMFEAPMFSGLQTRDRKSSWPASRRSTWNALAKKPEAIHRVVTHLIGSDNAFKTDTQNAYCVSWAMTLYLSQRRSQQYGMYLQKVGNGEPFHEYPKAQRSADFDNAFGADIRIMTKKMIDYLDALP